MVVKKRVLIIMIFISLLFMSGAFAIYVNNLDIKSKSSIKEKPVDIPDFEIDYDILSQNLILEKTEFIIDFTLHYLGTDPLYFWDLNFSVPDDIEVKEIVNASYILEENKIKVSNQPGSEAILSNEKFTFTIAFMTSEADYYPNTFVIGNYKVEEVLRAKLKAFLNRVSASGNIYAYNIIIENTGNIMAENWRLCISSHPKFQIRSLANNINYVQQPNMIILSNQTDNSLAPHDSIVIGFTFMSNEKNWYPEVLELSSSEQVK